MSMVATVVNSLQVRRRAAPIAYSARMPLTGLSQSGNVRAYLAAYGEVGWLFATVSRIASSVGESNWSLYWVGAKGQKEEIFEHPLLDVWRKPNPFMTQQRLLEYTQMYLDLTGNAWIIMNPSKIGRPAEMWPVSPQYMRIVPSKEKYIAGYYYERGGEKIPFPVEDVLHFSCVSPLDQYYGLGPVQGIAIDLDTEKFASEYQRNFFVNSARPDGVLESESTLSDEQWERIQETWQEEHRGVERAHRIAVLEAGLKYKQLALSQEQMGLYEQRKLSRDIILGAYGVPKMMLGIVEEVTRSTAESSEWVYSRWVILPRLKSLMRGFAISLVNRFDKRLELGFTDPTPDNREQSRLDADSGVSRGYWMVDEARAATGLAPLPNNQGRVFLMPLTTMVVGESALGPGTATAPAEGASFAAVPLIKAPPVVLTTEAKNVFGEAFFKAADAWIPRMSRLMMSYWNVQAKEALAALEGEKAAAKQLSGRLTNQWWAGQVTKLRFKMAPQITAMVREAGAAATVNYRLGIEFDPDDPRVARWAGDRLRRISKAINDTTAERVDRIVRDGEAQGLLEGDIFAKVRDYYRGLESRADTVARTEILAASNRGAMEAFRQGGALGKEWWSMQDDRVRPWHQDAHGQMVGIDEQFSVGGEMLDQPGEGSPANQCNCRCLLHPVMEYGIGGG